MLEKVRAHIDENLPFLREGKLLLAISGGIDSVVLAHLFHKLQLNFGLAHCNFKLRYDDSDKDEVFVKHLAEKLGAPCNVIHFNTRKYAEENRLSTQMAARELRYNWFDKLLREKQYSYVITAHHTNDNLETVLINLTRGASLSGLTGIPEVNKKIIRPLLPFTRSEIEHFTITNNITWREDESNQSTKYFRNKIRHKVVPVLEELNKNVLATFNEHLDYLKKEQNVLKFHLEYVKKQVCVQENKLLKIDLKRLLEYDNISVYLHYILKEYQFTEWENIADLCLAQSGKFIVSKTHRLVKDRDFLLLEEKNLLLQDLEYKINEDCNEVLSPVLLRFEYVKEVKESLKNKIFISADLLEYPLCLRKKKDGDVFFPFGMKGKKKLSKYFKDEKLSLTEKENSWLLCDANDTIIWIVGKRADDRFRVTATAQKILKITLS